LKINWTNFKIITPADKVSFLTYIFIPNFNPFRDNLESLLRYAKNKQQLRK